MRGSIGRAVFVAGVKYGCPDTNVREQQKHVGSTGRQKQRMLGCAKLRCLVPR
jgi:hypothetical protein